MEYQPHLLEPKWQSEWEKNQTYRVHEDPQKPKFYVLDMFPYPSGAGLHVGHPLGYIASDIIARYKTMCGYSVLHPMGFDAFGLPAEQYAIQTGVHPAKSTAKNIETYIRQLKLIGFNYDWTRSINTSDPEYYRWTQWIFLQLFEHWYDAKEQTARPIRELFAHFEKQGSAGIHAVNDVHPGFTADAWKQMSAPEQLEISMCYRLAYRKLSYVNWCEALGTVLANDEVKDGLSERGGHPVTKKPLLQWSLRITAYAERLLSSLDTLEWSDAMKTMQRNWIGKSTGAIIPFSVKDKNISLEVFTTRPDTLFGVAFMVCAPDHDLVDAIMDPTQKDEIQTYRTFIQNKTERERVSEAKSITGVFTGGYCMHPITGKQLPIWISEYVLKEYGTGAIMAVPGHDDRDFAFAKQFGLDVIQVIDQSQFPGASREEKLGILIHSGEWTGMKVQEAIPAIIQWLEKHGKGNAKTQYKLRDAIYSRQRYWGEPFPIIYQQDGNIATVPEHELPVRLPDLDAFKPGASGESPLARVTQWTQVDQGLRETDTMPGYAGSSWYFLRYMDPSNTKEFASRKALEYWKEVDLYIGGTEHAVGHLMYSRFWQKFLFDLKKVPVDEPFRKLVNQGMIQGGVEYVCIAKEKQNASLQISGKENASSEAHAKIPIPVSFVKNYGTPSPYIDLESIKQLCSWRPEWEHAHWVTSGNNYTKDNFPKEEKINTYSEVGKMSKSLFNVINPDDVIKEYGADCFRLFEMFLGPLEQSKPWDIHGIEGVSKFLKRFWSLFFEEKNLGNTEPSKEENKIIHTTIKKLTEDIEKLSMNTCVSALMICVNELKKLQAPVHTQCLSILARLIAPFAPHIAEELWVHLKQTGSVHHAPWPAWEEKWMISDVITYPICFNGKRRGEIELPNQLEQSEIEKLVQASPEYLKWTENQTVKKIVIVPGKMINVVL